MPSLHIVSLAALVLMAQVLTAMGAGDKSDVNDSKRETVYDNLTLGIPGACDQVVEREGYALGYSRKYKQPLWVSYRITKEEAGAQTASRREAAFYDDGDVLGSAKLEDYRRSGYDRGHLAPAGDMKFSTKAMRESFSMANISPQVNAFNSGVWHRLEQYVRLAAAREGSLLVVTGPIFIEDEECPPKYIGAGKVRVPEFFYKVIYDETPPCKMIGFILANKASKRGLDFFAVSVDEVEEATGLDFFGGLPDEVEGSLESKVDMSEWKLNTRSS